MKANHISSQFQKSGSPFLTLLSLPNRKHKIDSKFFWSLHFLFVNFYFEFEIFLLALFSFLCLLFFFFYFISPPVASFRPFFFHLLLLLFHFHLSNSVSFCSFSPAILFIFFFQIDSSIFSSHSPSFRTFPLLLFSLRPISLLPRSQQDFSSPERADP